MKNKELQEGYNQAVSAKKNNKLAMILVTSFCGVITITALLLYMFSHLTIADKLKVVDTTGRELKSDLMRRDQVLKNALKEHVVKCVKYSNSFSRETYKNNQNIALLLMDRSSAFRIFEGYKKGKSYNDALKLGHIYEVETTKVTNLSTEKEPFEFIAESILVAQDGGRKNYFKIVSKGEITYRDPSYPYNSYGLWTSNYVQESTRINLTGDE